MAGQGWLPEAQHQCPVPVPAFAGCEVQVSPLFKGVRGAQPRPVPACPAVCQGAGPPFYGRFSQRGALVKFAQRAVRANLPPTHRDLDDLVEHDIRRDVEVEDEVLEGGRTQTSCHLVGSSEQPGAVLGPSLLAVPVCTPAIPLSPEPDEQQWQPLVFPGPGAGGKPGPNRRARPQSLADWGPRLGFVSF